MPGKNTRLKQAIRPLTTQQWVEKEKVWQKELAQVKEQVEQLNIDISCAQKEKESQDQRLLEVQLENKALREQVERVKEDNKHLNCRLEKEQEVGQGCLAKVQALERRIQEQQEGLNLSKAEEALLRERLTIREDEISSLKFRVEEMRLQKDELILNLERMHSVCKSESLDRVRMDEELQAWKRKAEALATAIEEEKRETTEALQKSEYRFVSLKQGLQQQGILLRTQLNTLREEKTAIDAQKDILKSTLCLEGKSLQKIEQDISECFSTFLTYLHQVISDKEMFKAQEQRRWKTLGATLKNLHTEMLELSSYFGKRVEAEVQAKNEISAQLGRASAKLKVLEDFEHERAFLARLASKVFEERVNGRNGPRVYLSKVRSSEVFNIIERGRIARSTYSEIPLGKFDRRVSQKMTKRLRC